MAGPPVRARPRLTQGPSLTPTRASSASVRPRSAPGQNPAQPSPIGAGERHQRPPAARTPTDGAGALGIPTARAGECPWRPGKSRSARDRPLSTPVPPGHGGKAVWGGMAGFWLGGGYRCGFSKEVLERSRLSPEPKAPAPGRARHGHRPSQAATALSPLQWRVQIRINHIKSS